MSFEMKYDKDGMPITPKQVLEEPAIEPVEQPVEHSTSPDETVQQSEESSTESIHTETESAPHHAAKSNKEENMRRLREKAELLERERDEALRLANEMKSKFNPTAAAFPEVDEEVTLSEEDLVEGKHLNRFQKKIKKLEQQLQSYQQQTSEIAVESQLKSQYADFDKVVTRENIETLRLTYPELAQTINSSSSDLYSKAVSAYTLIKRLGVYAEDTYQNERERAHKNATKPKPLASVSPQQGDTPLSHANAFANGLTDELKEQLRKEMMAARRAY